MSRFAWVLLLMPLLPQSGMGQDPRCCVLEPDGTGVRVDLAPVPTNLKELADSLEANRPAALDGAASTATAVVWLHVGTAGSVLETRIHTGTGSDPIDAMFLRVAAVLRFDPAILDEKPVDVWIRIPFTVQYKRVGKGTD